MKTFSIVIPCRNEEKYIEKCIQSILNQNYPKENIEIVVCDGKSEDSTSNIVSDLSNRNKEVCLIINEKQTTPFALNLGIKKAKNEVVIILGAHSELAPAYLTECNKLFNKYPNAGCIGGVINNIYENSTSQIIGLAMSSSFGVGNAHFRTGTKEGEVDTVAFGAYPKEVFEKAGLFDEDLARNQDDEFNYRVNQSGFKIYLSNKLQVQYYVRASFSKLFRQYFQYGYWKVLVNKKHKTITTIRQLVPAVFVGYLFLLPVMFVYGKLLLPYLVGTACYFSLSLVFGIKSAKSIVQFPSIVLAFFVLHFSYGLGYIKGAINFILLNKNAQSNPKLSR